MTDINQPKALVDLKIIAIGTGVNRKTRGLYGHIGKWAGLEEGVVWWTSIYVASYCGLSTVRSDNNNDVEYSNSRHRFTSDT
jgi:hypothetical protein